MTTQPTPSPHQHEPAPFTTGPVKAQMRPVFGERFLRTTRQGKNGGRKYICAFPTEDCEEGKANILLMEACFNSATALHEAGYDAQRVIEALPEIMEKLKVTSYYQADHANFIATLRRTRGPQ